MLHVQIETWANTSQAWNNSETQPPSLPTTMTVLFPIGGSVLTAVVGPHPGVPGAMREEDYPAVGADQHCPLRSKHGNKS